MHKRKVSVQVSSSILIRDAETKKRILGQFPKISLSDETLLHQKVQNADVYVATPYGTKYFAWITDQALINQNQNKREDTNCVCLFIEARNITSTDVHSQPTMFYVPIIQSVPSIEQKTNENTAIKWPNHYIFHGILFNITPLHFSSAWKQLSLSLENRRELGDLNVQRCKNAAYFATDHVYDCKHANVTGRKTFEQNLQTLRYIFNHEAFVCQIRQPFIENHALHFGAPIMERHFPNLVSQIQDLPYNIQYIYFRYNKRPDNETVQFVKYFKPNKNKVADNNTQATATGPTTGQPMGKLTDAISNATKPNAYINNNVKRLSHAVFKAYPLPRQDCYKLFALTANAEEQYVDLAYIPNYKTSIMMNTLLRNVKENTNMDALEESDDEEEFENPEEDELLNLAKSIHILCEYSPKFKKWVPMSKSEQPPILTTELGM